MTNPFKPSAGSSPPELIGRQSIAGADPGSRARRPRGPGPRQPLQRRSRDRQDRDAERGGGGLPRRGMAAGRTRPPPRACSLSSWRTSVDSSRRRRRVPSGASPGSRRVASAWTGRTPTTCGPVDLRSTVEELLDLLAPDRGLLVTIDEVHGGERNQLREVAALSQHMVRDDRQFALAMAGLPSSVSNLLSDDVLTFLRRADRHDLRALAVDDVEDALRHTVESSGRRLGRTRPARRPGPRRATRSWCSSSATTAGGPDDGIRITATEVDEGIRMARQRLREPGPRDGAQRPV